MNSRSTGAGVVFLVSMVLLLVLGLRNPFGPLARWFVPLALMSVALLAIGYGITGRVWGVLIDDRNKFSLSRLQLVIWTLVVLSAYLAAVLAQRWRRQLFQVESRL